MSYKIKRVVTYTNHNVMAKSNKKKVESYLQIRSNICRIYQNQKEWLPNEGDKQALQRHIDDIEAFIRVLDRYKTELLETE